MQAALVSAARPCPVVGCRPPHSSSSSSSSRRAGHAQVVHGASSFHDPALHNSIDRLVLHLQQQQQQLRQVNPLQQQPRDQQEQQQQLRGAAPAQSSQETDLLWAGYSALEEQLRQSQRHHESLRAQVEALQAKLHAAQSPGPPVSAWQAASFLLVFLGFMNFVSVLVNMHVALVLPFWAGGGAKAAAGAGTALWMKQALGVALPVTNTVVCCIFCLQAVKAAWHCLRW